MVESVDVVSNYYLRVVLAAQGWLRRLLRPEGAFLATVDSTCHTKPLTRGSGEVHIGALLVVH